MPLSITIRGDREALRRVRKMGASVSASQRAVLNRRAATVLYGSVISTFREQGATEGRPKWEPLKAGGRYVGTGRKRKDGSRGPRRFQTAYKILQDTGALRASWVPLSDANVAGVGAASVKGHADLAPIHEQGNAARGLPARRQLPTERRALGVVTEIYLQAITQGARP